MTRHRVLDREPMLLNLATKYLIRFDDLCPTMNWVVWDEIEATLDAAGVKPILAVVPDNQDPGLKVSPPVPGFWDRVRSWRAKEWTIAMHGYQHRCATSQSGILRLNPCSEFAGLPPREQETKLNRAFEIFRREGIEPEAWVAPAHSLDAATVHVLQAAGLRVISDGLSSKPYRDHNGVLWVPQQIWRFRKMPPGIWTICFHHNHWTSRHIAQFRRDVETYRDKITNLDDVCRTFVSRRQTLGDRVFATGWWCAIQLLAGTDRLRGLRSGRDAESRLPAAANSM